MRKFSTKYFFIFLCLFLVFVNAYFYSHAHAQQTIVNVVSSEVLPAGQMVLKQSNRFRPFYPDEYTTLTPTATFGIGKGFELSTGVGTTLDGEGTMVRGDFAVKKVWFLGSSTRLTVGGMVSPYFSEKANPNSFVFTHVSQRIKKTKTSITAGVYMDGRNSFPDKFGALIGLEQVLIPNKLRLACDWMSGNDSYGRIGVGLKYRPVPSISLSSAVIIPNKDSENIGFNVSVSKYVSLKEIKENKYLKRRL